MIRRAVLCTVSLLLVASACSSDDALTPEERAVGVYTTACGHASKTTGSGIVVDDERVVTVAHVVIGATDVSVTAADGLTRPATIVHVDTLRDLAVLKVEQLAAGPVGLVDLEMGDGAVAVGMASGSVPAEVLRRVTLSVDEVRGTERSRRSGYELAASIDGGDSGAGLFDRDGRLVGVVFAVPTERDGIAWATGSSEIAAMLDEVVDGTEYRCDADAARVVPSP